MLYVAPMASDDTATTESTDSNAEGEQGGTPGPGAAAGAGEGRAGGGGAAGTTSAADYGAGAAAAVSAGLGLSSLTGTSLSDMLRSREEILGQIQAATGGGGDQVDALYGAPWHTAALVNGIFALFAVLIGAGVMLAARARRAGTGQPWVAAVALGGVVLGAIGLLVAGGMYFDLFAAQPALPAMGG